MQRYQSTRVMDEVNDQMTLWFLMISQINTQSAQLEHHSSRQIEHQD